MTLNSQPSANGTQWNYKTLAQQRNQLTEWRDSLPSEREISVRCTSRLHREQQQKPTRKQTAQSNCFQKKRCYLAVNIFKPFHIFNYEANATENYIEILFRHCHHGCPQGNKGGPILVKDEEPSFTSVRERMGTAIMENSVALFQTVIELSCYWASDRWGYSQRSVYTTTEIFVHCCSADNG